MEEKNGAEEQLTEAFFQLEEKKAEWEAQEKTLAAMIEQLNAELSQLRTQLAEVKGSYQAAIVLLEENKNQHSELSQALERQTGEHESVLTEQRNDNIKLHQLLQVSLSIYLVPYCGGVNLSLSSGIFHSAGKRDGREAGRARKGWFAFISTK